MFATSQSVFHFRIRTSFQVPGFEWVHELLLLCLTSNSAQFCAEIALERGGFLSIFFRKDKKNEPFGTEPTWHAPAAGDGRKAGLPMVKLPSPRRRPSAQRRQLVVPPAPSAPSVPSVPSVSTVPRSAPSPPPAPSRCPDVRAERRRAPALAAKRVQ